MSNDYLYFVAQAFAKPLNDAHTCGGDYPKSYIFMVQVSPIR